MKNKYEREETAISDHSFKDLVVKGRASITCAERITGADKGGSDFLDYLIFKMGEPFWACLKPINWEAKEGENNYRERGYNCRTKFISGVKLALRREKGQHPIILKTG